MNHRLYPTVEKMRQLKKTWAAFDRFVKMNKIACGMHYKSPRRVVLQDAKVFGISALLVYPKIAL
jgi:hypothetical protein